MLLITPKKRRTLFEHHRHWGNHTSLYPGENSACGDFNNPVTNFLSLFYHCSKETALLWPGDSVRSYYNGPVRLKADAGTYDVDMRYSDYLGVSDPSVEYLRLTAEQPRISSHYATWWHLVSLPVAVEKPRPALLFPSLRSSACSYVYGASRQQQVFCFLTGKEPDPAFDH